MLWLKIFFFTLYRKHSLYLFTILWLKAYIYMVFALISCTLIMPKWTALAVPGNSRNRNFFLLMTFPPSPLKWTKVNQKVSGWKAGCTEIAKLLLILGVRISCLFLFIPFYRIIPKGPNAKSAEINVKIPADISWLTKFSTVLWMPFNIFLRS